MTPTLRPKLKVLSDELIDRIVAEAIELLETTGVMIEGKKTLELLQGLGVRTDLPRGRAFFNEEMVHNSLKLAPSTIRLYDREGNLSATLEGDNVYFNPGSAALDILDYPSGKMRKPVTTDLVRLAKLTDSLEHIKLQSTALISTDIPQAMSDWYRLYLGFLHCRKPMVTGIFAVESLHVMKEMLVIIRGDEKRLVEKPLAIFDACPSPPLKWSQLTCQSLIDCARWGIPSELISMPMAGATSPVTLSATLVQHTAENLSGVVISQLVKPGAPVIYGGSPSILDMRKGTTPMGAIETMLLNSANCQIGKRLGLPVHAYMGLSDAKILDSQSGLEGGMSILLAALAGINVVSGPGMLEFESCQSLEKLVIDNEICGMAYRLLEGIAQRDEPIATELLKDVKPDSHFLSSPHTLRWFREELYFPSIIERRTYGEWQKQGGKSLADKAAERVEDFLRKEVSPPLSDDLQKALQQLASRESRQHGLQKLPSSE